MTHITGTLREDYVQLW